MLFVIVEATPYSMIGAGQWPADGLKAYPYPFKMVHPNGEYVAYGYAEEPSGPAWNDTLTWARNLHGFNAMTSVEAEVVQDAVDAKANPPEEPAKEPAKAKKAPPPQS